MCKKKQFKYYPSEIDGCMNNILEHIHGRVVSCCCGHGKYPMTIIKKMGFADNPYLLEIVSGKVIPRKRNFYRKDGYGYYYIPEVSKPRFKTKIIRRKTGYSIIRRSKR